MSFGKLNQQIQLISTTPTKDAEGFATMADTVLATVWAYREDRHGNTRWANMAAFSSATSLFRFRAIPGLVVDTSLSIIYVPTNERYRILSVEDVKGRNMYWEILADKIEPTVR